MFDQSKAIKKGALKVSHSLNEIIERRKKQQKGKKLVKEIKINLIGALH